MKISAERQRDMIRRTAEAVRKHKEAKPILLREADDTLPIEVPKCPAKFYDGVERCYLTGAVCPFADVEDCGNYYWVQFKERQNNLRRTDL